MLLPCLALKTVRTYKSCLPLEIPDIDGQMAIAAFDTVAAPNVDSLPAVAKRCARSGSNGRPCDTA